MHELLDDVFNDEDEVSANEVNVPVVVTTPVQSPLSLPDNNVSTKEIELSNKENEDNIENSRPHSEIEIDNVTGDSQTPMPSPSSIHECHVEFCACSENESPPILTNDDLYGNLPTPSVATITSFNTPTSVKSVKTRQASFKTDKGKKRLKHQENWVVNKRKFAKNQGKSFINARGKEVPAKGLKEPCNEKCRLKCSSKFDENQRNKIFQKFWDLGDRQRQWEFVIRFTKKIPKRRQTTETTKHDRKNTFFYFLPDSKTQNVKVCKTMFLNTISAGERIITTSWKKYDGEISVSGDQRGKYQHKNRVIDEEMTRSVYDHVKSFSLVESHYIRKN